jgi:hypothetical protein
MAEVLKPGVVFDPIDGGREIYVEEVIGTHTFEQNVVLTFAVNRVQPDTAEGATSVRQVVARLVSSAPRTRSLKHLMRRQLPSRSIRKHPVSHTSVMGPNILSSPSHL